MNISVVIPTYGGQEWADLALSRALPSADGQGAYDMVVVHQPEGTIASARNAGAERAAGDWLCFLDADDELGRGYIAAIQRAHQRHQDYRVLFTPIWQKVEEDGRRQPPRFLPEVNLATGNWMVIGTVISRALFNEVGGFREWPHGLEDFDLWSRVWRAGCQIVKVPRAVYIAHWNENSKHHQGQRDRDNYLAAYQRVLDSHKVTA